MAASKEQKITLKKKFEEVQKAKDQAEKAKKEAEKARKEAEQQGYDIRVTETKKCLLPSSHSCLLLQQLQGRHPSHGGRSREEQPQEGPSLPPLATL